MKQPHRPLFVAFLVLACGFILACRTVDYINAYQAAQAQPSPTLSKHASATRTRRSIALESPTETATDIPTEVIPMDTEVPTEPPPTDVPPPTDEPTHTPRPLPTHTRAPTNTPTPSGPTATPAPTRCPQQYCAVFKGCQAESGNTVVEGTVVSAGAPENNVWVRAALAEGAYPIVEFESGTDPINPGVVDPKNPGHYILQIAAGSAQEGDWFIFVVDKKKGTNQLSDAVHLHTNGDPNTGSSCEHAFIDFVQ